MYKKIRAAVIFVLIVMYTMDFIPGISSISQTYAKINQTKMQAPVIQGYEKVAENNKLALFVDSNTLALKVLNKTTGYIWDSALTKKDNDMNSDWQNFSSAGLTVEYIDDTNKVSQISSLSNNSKINITKGADGFTSEVIFPSVGFDLKFNVRLQDDAVNVSIPYKSIQELNDSYKIEKIYVFPFLGASKKQEENGYIFFPDGCGALMYTNKKSAATQPYVSRIYGDDKGFTNLEQVASQNDFGLESESKRVYMPVFGITKQINKNAVCAVIDSGAEYAEINMYPAGITTDYNWITPKFIYRQAYQQPVDRKGNGIIMNQKNKNVFDISLKYMFLSNNSANYTGMALSYQKYLLQNHKLVKRSTKDVSMPLNLYFLGADNKGQLIGRKTIYMTKCKDVQNIIDDLSKNNVKKFNIVIDGYEKNGLTNSWPMHFPFDSKIGTKEDWAEISKRYNNLATISFYTNYLLAFRDAKGYTQSDVAQTISEQLITSGNNQFYKYLNAKASKRMFDNEIGAFKGVNGGNIVFSGIGANLNSNFGKINLTRLESESYYKAMLEQNKMGRIGIEEPNDYLWKYASDIYYIPMDSSEYVLSQETVPFMQIVLRGYVNYYGQCLNFSANPKVDLLKSIDYGCYPSYIITNEDPINLLDTQSNWIYSSKYSVWKNRILSDYKTISSVLNKVAGATITNRESLSNGIVKVSYSNGVKIYINYTSSKYKNNEVSVLPLSCVAVRGN